MKAHVKSHENGTAKVSNKITAPVNAPVSYAPMAFAPVATAPLASAPANRSESSFDLDAKRTLLHGLACKVVG